VIRSGKCRRAVVWVLALYAAFAAALAAADNDDFIILLDQSMSMLEKKPGDETQGYYRDDPSKAEKSREAVAALDNVIGRLIRTGDYVAVVLFGNDARVIVSQQLRHDFERGVIRDTIAGLRFQDRNTDIVAGIAEASDLISKLGSKERRKILVMVTDGKNDPDRKTSPFFSEPAQSGVYSTLKRNIRDGRWRVALVGLGAHTDISDVSRNLGLGTGNTITFAPGDHESIREGLYNVIRDERDAKVASTADSLTIRPRTRFFGGYYVAHTSVTLKSAYRTDVTVAFDPQIGITGLDGLAGTATPSKIVLKPGGSATFDIEWRYTGGRPDDGTLGGRFAFAFPNSATPFYPHAGDISLILASWWDTYGLRVIVAMVCATLAAALVYRSIRKRQVPQIKVQVLSGTTAIAEPRTLRKGGKIKIANGDLAGGGVPAPGLDVSVAAVITYLGRQRFRADADEADIIMDGSATRSVQFGLDESFDLRDAKGKTLRALSLSTSTSYADDAFGDYSSADSI
jgi:hypothetical protein